MSTLRRQLRRFALTTLFAWIPIQASAASWVAYQCDLDGSTTHENAAMSAGPSLHETGHPLARGGLSSVDDAYVHACCHHFTAAVLIVAPSVGGEATQAAPVAAPSAHPYRFFPELLDRPPAVGRPI
jgi:hypothetical protein